ncbi:hypothetical protein RKD19_001050 [Streptomyces canus]
MVVREQVRRSGIQGGKGWDTMGTSLTAEFWRQFAVLLVAAVIVTFALSAALDALYLRRQRRRAARRPADPGAPKATPLPERPVVRTPVRH